MPTVANPPTRRLVLAGALALFTGAITLAVVGPGTRARALCRGAVAALACLLLLGLAPGAAAQADVAQPEVEPNNTEAEADTAPVRITGGGIVAGSLSPSSDRDSFRVSVPAGTTQLVDLLVRDASGEGCPASGMLLEVYWQYATSGRLVSVPEDSCAQMRLRMGAGVWHVVLRQLGRALPSADYRLYAAFTELGQCRDGQDNDLDGRRDFPEDFGCEAPTDDSESPDPPEFRRFEQEPNDAGWQADGNPWLFGNGHMVGSIDPLSDRDYFHLHVDAGWEADLETYDGADPACSGTTTALRLWNFFGQEVRSDEDSGPGSCSRLENIGPGDHWVSVEELGRDARIAAYHLVVSGRRAPRCADTLNNDADPWIDFPADPGCESPRDDSESPDPPRCSDGRDNDADGKIDYPADPGCFDATQDWESPDPPACSDRADNDGDGSADYPNDPGCDSANEASEAAPAGLGEEREPNDTREQAAASPLAIGGGGGAPLLGAIGPHGDRDLFRLELTQAGTVRVETTDGNGTGCPFSIDTVARLLSATGAQIAVDDDGGINFCSLIEARLAPGTYFVSVAALSPTAGIPRYRLTTSFEPAKECGDHADDDGDGKTDFPEDPGCDSLIDPSEAPDATDEREPEREPNDTSTDADSSPLHLVDGSAVVGAIEPRGETDIYRLDIARTSIVVLETRDGAGTGCAGDTVIALRDRAAGWAVADNDSGIGECSLLEHTLEPGTYYVEIGVWGGGSVLPGYRLLTTITPVDSQPPSVGHRVTPEANAAGWHDRDATVELSASDDDPGSGVKEIVWSATGAGSAPQTTVAGGATSIPVTAEGETTVTYLARDNAGNSSQPQSVTVRIDETAPTVDCDEPDDDWRAANVAFDCGAHDGGSGLPYAGDASFVLATSVPAGDETAAADTGFRQVCDLAGNCVTAGPLGPVKVDRKLPAIAIASPADETFALDDAPAAAYECSDAGSQIDACRGDVANGAALETSTTGVHTFTVTAIDKAGNRATASTSYTVQVTVASVCRRTTQYIRASERYQALPPRQREAGDWVANAVCQKLEAITPQLTSAQKERLVNTYKLAVSALVAGGWLTEAHAATLAGLAEEL